MKRDRFEQIVEKWAMQPMKVEHDARDEMAKLLRKEHAAVRKVITMQQREYQELAFDAVKAKLSPECWDMRVEACLDILAALDRRAKGGMKHV